MIKTLEQLMQVPGRYIMVMAGDIRLYHDNGEWIIKGGHNRIKYRGDLSGAIKFIVEYMEIDDD